MIMNRIPLIEGVSSSFVELATASESLNLVSDELGKAVSDIDAGLRKLGLGVTAWVQIYAKTDTSEEDPIFLVEELGYAKVGRWGVALRTRSRDDRAPEPEETIETFLFNDAPRKLRLKAIEKLPELLKKLSEEAAKVTKELQAKLAYAQAVAVAVNPSVPPVSGIEKAVIDVPRRKGGFMVKGQQTGSEVEK
jgi:hypothetical protein